jgi:hypothetical protein
VKRPVCSPLVPTRGARRSGPTWAAIRRFRGSPGRADEAPPAASTCRRGESMEPGTGTGTGRGRGRGSQGLGLATGVSGIRRGGPGCRRHKAAGTGRRAYAAPGRGSGAVCGPLCDVDRMARLALSVFLSIVHAVRMCAGMAIPMVHGGWKTTWWLENHHASMSLLVWLDDMTRAHGPAVPACIGAPPGCRPAVALSSLI